MGTLVCRIELDKKKGVLLTVENGDGKITQTIVMDGTNITTTVNGSDETSTIIQKQDSIALKCKTFKLDAETITCKSTKETLHESGQNFNIKSGQDFDIKSGKNIGVSATSNAEYNAVNTTVKSTVKTEIKGVSIKLDATGMMDLISSGIATLEGSVVNIKGKVNNIG